MAKRWTPVPNVINRWKRHIEDSAMTQPPPPRRTLSGLAAVIVIAIILLALTWPNNTGYDRICQTQLSEQ
jgi:hypothetical protein